MSRQEAWRWPGHPGHPGPEGNEWLRSGMGDHLIPGPLRHPITRLDTNARQGFETFPSPATRCREGRAGCGMPETRARKLAGGACAGGAPLFSQGV